MENDLLEKIVEGKVYSIKTIIMSSFFAGIIASGFMLYKNFKTFGEQRKANLTIVFSIIILLALIATIFIPAL
jgi:hypothetical protein